MFPFMEQEVVKVATRNLLLAIIKEVSKRMKEIKKHLIDPYEVCFSNKNLSEL